MTLWRPLAVMLVSCLTLNVADAVAVEVEEAANVDLIDHRPLPPLGSRLVVASGRHYRQTDDRPEQRQPSGPEQQLSSNKQT
jgi:hypothetical protein